MPNIKCFHYHEFRHHATKCPQNKASKKEPVIATTGEALASQFKLDFTLIAFMSRTVMGSMWYLDSNALFLMTWNRDLFIDLEEKYIKKNIDF